MRSPFGASALQLGLAAVILGVLAAALGTSGALDRLSHAAPRLPRRPLAPARLLGVGVLLAGTFLVQLN